MTISLKELSHFSRNILTMPISHGSELRAFHAAARAGSMSGGARHLGLTQPTVSAHVATLESTYGVELFFRRGRRVELTEFGRRMLETTHRLVDAEVEALSLLLHARNSGSGDLRISAVGPYNVTPMLGELRRVHPGVRISMSVGDSQQILESIASYQSDVGVLVHPVADPRIFCMPYRKQPLVFFAAASHPLARRAQLTMADLAGHSFVMREQGSTTRRVLEQCLAQEGVQVRSDLEIGSREAVREAVAQGLGIGVVSDAAYLADPRTVKLPIRCDQLFTHAHVVCLRERRDVRMIAQFFAIVLALRSRNKFK